MERNDASCIYPLVVNQEKDGDAIKGRAGTDLVLQIPEKEGAT
jgi:hypothetical protein